MLSPSLRSSSDSIHRIAPPPDLAPFVESLAGRRALRSKTLFPVFPTARAELIFHFADPFLVGDGDPKSMRPLAPATLLGPRRRLYWQAAGPAIDWFMVQLSPLGLRRLLGLRFAETWDGEFALADCWGGGAVLHERLAGAASFAERTAIAVATLRQICSDDPDPLSEAVSGSRAGRLRSIRALCIRLDIGPRRLHQRFVADMGIAPKLFLSLMRFGRQLEALHPRPMLAAGESPEPEYADDSHAIREFRRFAGVTPGAYVAQKRQGDRLVYTGAAMPLDA